MPSLVALLLFIDIALLVVALLDCLSVQQSGIRRLPRTAWIFVILLLSPVGALAWFVAGQPAPPIRLADGTVLRPGGRKRRARVRTGPIGPEDDPDFIQALRDSLRANGT